MVIQPSNRPGSISNHTYNAYQGMVVVVTLFEFNTIYESKELFYAIFELVYIVYIFCE